MKEIAIALKNDLILGDILWTSRRVFIDGLLRSELERIILKSGF